MLLGSHLSIAGGLENALLAADAYGFETVAMFVRNQRQWAAGPLRDEAVGRFRRVRRRLKIRPVVAHGSYLVNLAGKHAIRRKSIAAMRHDVDRCGRLGVEYLVFHPGSREDAGRGIGLIAEALNQIVAACSTRRAKVLLETTAGQGNCIGHTFEQLARILARLARPRRFGICLDTCHVFAAGYDVRSPRAYRQTMAALDRVIGLDRVLAVHLNDSLKDLGGRVDRHAHIGHGKIGLKGFANLVNDPDLGRVPMILETPKEKDDSGRDWDEINAEALWRLVRKRRS